ncbi:MAG: hypothetical protein GY861_25365 [bacterium]|nr:hypothetical protein [bacterium]
MIYRKKYIVDSHKLKLLKKRKDNNRLDSEDNQTDSSEQPNKTLTDLRQLDDEINEAIKNYRK